MQWEVFTHTINSSDRQAIEYETLTFLNKLEREGWEPRSIRHWNRNAFAVDDAIGEVTVYCRRKPE